jgi:ubiquinone/menaquinone biosynthesis C-methylase UbiE
MDSKSIYSENLSDWPLRSGLRFEEDYLIRRFLRSGDKILEAGTAGGRLLHALNEKGFDQLYGFDFIPEYIEIARQRDNLNTINFIVADATDLKYQNDYFDSVIYLQQIISNIPNRSSRSKAVKEAFRVLKPGGYAIFSFLSFEAREFSKIHKPLILWLKLIRFIKREYRSIHDQPWIKLPGGKFNFRFLLDQKPYNHWFDKYEAIKILSDSGFKPLFCGMGSDLMEMNIMSCEDFFNSPRSKPGTGMIYFVCKKPTNNDY